MAIGVTLEDRVNVQAILETAVAVPASLRKAVYFIDDPEIPVDLRYLEVTKSDYANYFASTGYPYAYANLHFSQKRIPASLQVARWAQAASNPYWVAGSAYNTTVATWAAISDGSLRVALADTPATYDDVTGIDLSGVTSMDNLVTALNAELAAFTPVNITGLDSAEFSYDSTGRLILTMPGTGASAVSVTILDGSAGTPLYTLLDGANGLTQDGLDAESIVDAIDALRAANDTGIFYTAKFTTASASARATEILAMAGKVEALNKFAVVTADDTDIKNSAVTTDIFSQLDTLAYKRTMGIYFEAISSRPKLIPEAAVLGCVIPAEEGSTAFNQEDLTGMNASGYSAPLSKAQTDVIVTKGGNVIESVAGYTYLYNGNTFGGVELRIMVGRDWFLNTIASAVFSYQMSVPLAAFDDETIAAITAIVKTTGEEAIRRRILVDTVARPFTVTPPDADDFTQAQRASHVMSITDFFQGYLNSSVTDYLLVGTWTI